MQIFGDFLCGNRLRSQTIGSASRSILDRFGMKTRPSFRTSSSVNGLGTKLNSRALRFWRRVVDIESSSLLSCRECEIALKMENTPKK